MCPDDYDTTTPGPGLYAASRVLARPWTLLILACIDTAPQRFTDIATALTGISTNLLSERLRMLTQAGLVERRQDGPVTVYALSRDAGRLSPILADLERWGQGLLHRASCREVVGDASSGS